MTPNPFVIDCDTGRDDALAIWIAIRLGLPLKAVVSSYGNTTLANVVENNRRVIHLAKTPIPLFTGSDKPSQDHRAYRDLVLPRQHVSGNGLCNIDLPPASPDLRPDPLRALWNYILDQSDENGPIDYIITGPATNLTAILGMASAQQLQEHIGTITMMGGKFAPLWQQIPGADFNLACDPAAIQAIFESNIPIRFVPMNATWPIAMTIQEIEQLKPQDDIARTAKKIMIAHCRHFSPDPVFRFHDPSVIMAWLYPGSFVQERATINMNESSADFGRLTPDPAGYPVSIFRPDRETQADFLEKMLRALGFTTPS